MRGEEVERAGERCVRQAQGATCGGETLTFVFPLPIPPALLPPRVTPHPAPPHQPHPTNSTPLPSPIPRSPPPDSQAPLRASHTHCCVRVRYSAPSLPAL